MVELVTIHGNTHNRTGCDLHDHDPVFTYCGEPLSFDRHAVNYDWMRQSIPTDGMNKMLYHLSSSDDVELFGAVYDSIAYLFVVRVNDSIITDGPEYRTLDIGETVQYGDEVLLLDGTWQPVSSSVGYPAGVPRVGAKRVRMYRRPLNDSIPNPEPEKRYRLLEHGEQSGWALRKSKG